MFIAFASALALNSQPAAGPPQPLVVNLCNDTPSRVAYSLLYPGRAMAERRRGWLAVEPGQCLDGAIGDTVGGQGYVHVMSGEYRFPTDGGDTSACVPAQAHDSDATRPPCRAGEQTVSYERVAIERLRGRYQLSHRVSCTDFGAEDTRFCETGRRDRQGFAEAVRTLEVCNRTSASIRVTHAGEALAGDARPVAGWRTLAAGACADVWRGLTRSQRVYAYAISAPAMNREADFVDFCVDPNADFERLAPLFGDEACSAGQSLIGFKPLRFGESVSRMTLDIGG